MKPAYDFATWSIENLSKFAADLWAVYLLQKERIKELENIIERHNNENGF